MAIGERLFMNNCSQCHGSDARGSNGFPNLTYTNVITNIDDITAAVMNGYDYRAGQPPDGTQIGTSINLSFSVAGPGPGGYTIVFQGSSTAASGDDGNYRVTIDNTKLVPITFSNPLEITVWLNAVQVYSYNVGTTIGVAFTDIAIVAGDVLMIQPAIDGFDAPLDNYNMTVTIIKLP